MNLGRDATCFESMVGKKSSTQMSKSERNSFLQRSTLVLHAIIVASILEFIILIINLHLANKISWTFQLHLRDSLLIIIVNSLGRLMFGFIFNF